MWNVILYISYSKRKINFPFNYNDLKCLAHTLAAFAPCVSANNKRQNFLPFAISAER